MSTTMISTGHIAVLINPIDPDDLEELIDKLSDDDGVLGLNYEGTLLSSDLNIRKKYSEREFDGDLFIVGSIQENDKKEFIELANEAGLEIDPDTIKPYTCVWYNGSDSPMMVQSKDEFLQK